MMSKPGDLLQPLQEQPAITGALGSSASADTHTAIRRLLIANRGEIACRVIQTAKSMGITTIAVYSEADRHARHVRMADEALCIGPAPALDSYLAIDKLIDAAKNSQADAIHPGYGFLSENVAFARACQHNQIIFIGPGPSAMAAMSSKSDAKTIMSKAGVPLLPGYHGDEDNLENLTKTAAQIGYPVILKPALGGGGKGMKIVHRESELTEAVQSARREAKSAFGDQTLLLEKYLTQPRHIEVQIFADQHGNCVYLSDRDCSVQRRHQKIIEEAPAPGLSDRLRKEMGEAAVQAALAIQYVGAGTVEFLYDSQSQAYYFMEMNTRLQVEHPVTELITGQDLVQWQIRVAEGYRLPLAQHEIQHRGHAVEARLYAEDTEQDFLPASGLIQYLREPVTEHAAALPGHQIRARVDSGIAEGDTVTTHYDPMLAKVIAWAEDRQSAIQQLKTLLSDYQLGGLATNLKYLQRILSHEAFVQGSLSTHFIEHHQDALSADSAALLEIKSITGEPVHLPLNQLLCAVTLCFQQAAQRELTGWRLNQRSLHNITLCDPQNDSCLFVFESVSDGRIWLKQWMSGSDTLQLTPVYITLLELDSQVSVIDCKVEIHGARHQIRLVRLADSDALLAFTHGEQQQYQLRPNFSHHRSDQNDSPVAPLNGIVSEVLCQPGDTIEKDQGLVVIEAMKMEYTVRAPHDGQIISVLVSNGDQVQHGQELVQLSATGEEPGHTE
ncbi:ATP-grasp domain-containing protein [Photobacterium sp. CCB-ST2H9]|uniref:acetyl/propionyl/methylcrotonyl-CoA carboxylase subunit alpha n=1 Tax=Photobacterium sp. CCB-ST2H9 TaxID=2912855 RepID=UPI0020047E28|nr:biotin carboxylase N-terminal domain-containing protein [Photobacterium sp. CCB-ST2H9]UTM60038.1 ATP-grasp domain-containing protein [Photobacterium sp. CCB-ST2H9]